MRAARWLIVCALAMAACSRRPQVPEPEALADAADSARIAVWQPEEAKDDTLHHSAFYHGVLAYVEQSVSLERSKREYGEAVSALTPLTSAHLESNRYRNMAIDSLSHYADHASVWSSLNASIFAQYSVYVRHVLDSMYHDSVRYQRSLPDILRHNLFHPAWRPHYDSIESAIVGRTLDVLHLVDSNVREITFEEDLRFSDPEVADHYDALRKALDSLATEEKKARQAAN